jgi:hypothetical protein
MKTPHPSDCSYRTIPALLLAALAVGGCASSPNSGAPRTSIPLTQEARREPVGSSSESLNRRLEDLIEADAELTRARKDELLGVIRRMASKNEEIMTLINQKKSLLIKALLARPYQKHRVDNLKRSILRLNHERAQNGLQALEQLKEVMGHQDNPQTVMEKVMEMGGRI